MQDAALVPPANERIAPSYFNAKVLDYEGKVAGDIKAMIRNEDGERIVYFELDQSLTPADKPRDYHIAYDDVEIAEEEGARFIRLNKEQTEALTRHCIIMMMKKHRQTRKPQSVHDFKNL